MERDLVKPRPVVEGCVLDSLDEGLGVVLGICAAGFDGASTV